MCMEPKPKTPKENKVTVLGLGGSGEQILNHIQTQKDKYNDEYNLIYVDWDEENLSESTFEKINIAGASYNKLDTLKDSERIIIVTGLGGMFTSFATPMIISYIHHKLDIPTKLIVSTPASFEGKRRKNHAAKAIELIQELLTDYKVFEGDKLIELLDKKASLSDLFKIMDETVYQHIRRILNNYD